MSAATTIAGLLALFAIALPQVGWIGITGIFLRSNLLRFTLQEATVIGLRRMFGRAQLNAVRM